MNTSQSVLNLKTHHHVNAHNFSDCLGQVISLKDLNFDQVEWLFEEIMSGNLTSAQIGALLVAMRIKGECVIEIYAASQVMKKFATRVSIENTDNLIDIVGTGGDNHKTFNVSTTAMLVAGAAGARVAKHGSRAVSSTSGSSDTLAKLGVNIDMNEIDVARCVQTLGVGFMFAPRFHSAMKFVAPVRRELGVRTLFNVLGPLANPASVPRILLGVFNVDLQEKMAEVLRLSNVKRGLVVSSEDGMDELAISAPTRIIELNNGEKQKYQVTPESFGLNRQAISELKVGSSEEAAARMLSVLNGDKGAARDVVLLNAGAALYVAEIAKSISEGIDRARLVIDNGAAKKLLQDLISFGQNL